MASDTAAAKADASRGEETTDKVATISNHISRDPDELAAIVEAIESAGYSVEGPDPNDGLGVSGAEHNRWYWTIRE